MKFFRKQNITQLKKKLDQLEQQMLKGRYRGVSLSLNDLKEKIEFIKSIEISRSFSEIAIRAEQ